MAYHRKAFSPMYEHLVASHNAVINALFYYFLIKHVIANFHELILFFKLLFANITLTSLTQKLEEALLV